MGLDRRKPGAEVLEVGDDRELLCKHDLESPELHQLLVLCVCVRARAFACMWHTIARARVYHFTVPYALHACTDLCTDISSCPQGTDGSL